MAQVTIAIDAPSADEFADNLKKLLRDMPLTMDVVGILWAGGPADVVVDDGQAMRAMFAEDAFRRLLEVIE